ncbi:MAG: AAA family ATPase [Microcoleus sp. SU_5_6]|nr:AAA family ATPase [Microcoleus sp. SU_5_6]
MVATLSHKKLAVAVRSKDRTSIELELQIWTASKYRSKFYRVKHSKKMGRLNAAYCIADNIYLPNNTVKCYGIDSGEGDRDFRWEDIGGQSLEELMALQKLDLKDILRIAIAIVKIFTKIHQIPIIHKNIKPGNIIANLSTGKLKLCDFSIASRVTVESAKLGDSKDMIGTISYMSPEQTGRTNRLVDRRSDYYSLGVTCYELLTGKLPFGTPNDLETIGCHLAEHPTPPHQIDPTIPEVVSSIVMKLLEKNTEDRYQSPAGLIFDLQTCLSQLEKNGKIDCFRTGKRDKGRLLVLPQKLYGREQELDMLEAAFDRARRGNKEVIMISGASGNGKSAIARTVRKHALKAGGYFISGKFEKLKPNIPYIGFSQAFVEMIDQILTESPEKIAAWRKKNLARRRRTRSGNC